MGGAGADILYSEPKKKSGAGAEDKWLGSATLQNQNTNIKGIVFHME